MVICIPYNISFAEEKTIKLSIPDNTSESLPANMPENYLGYYSSGGTETKGVTFVISEVHYDEKELKISVIQLPNDDYTSVVDNSIEYSADNRGDFDREIETASQYGDKVLGTVCGISTITDGEGSNLFDECRISENRNGASMITEFYIYSLPENLTGEVNVELVFGVNEDLNYRFPMSDSIYITVPVP
ncbi:MAG: hypothetical protein GX096_03345 [Clostridiales bacterium]|nr:hypothetical protein [Clostridiales bacterium]